MEIKLLMRIAKHDGAINFISKTFLACYKFIWLQTSLALQEFLNTPRSFLIGRNESDRNNSIFALKIYFFADFQPYSDGIRILTVEIQHRCTIVVVFYSRTFCSCWLLEVKFFFLLRRESVTEAWFSERAEFLIQFYYVLQIFRRQLRELRRRY